MSYSILPYRHSMALYTDLYELTMGQVYLAVFVGSLALRKVPTDLLSGASTASPILLGRDALRPFRLTFDPLNRLIEFAPQ